MSKVANRRIGRAFLLASGVLLPAAAQSGPELSFRRCKPISAYRIEIADQDALKSLPAAQRKHVERFQEETQRPFPIYMLQPRPEMKDLTFILEREDCPDICRGWVYSNVRGRIQSDEFQYKKNFVDHVRISFDARGVFHGYNSGFRSVSFYFFGADKNDIIYFERSAFGSKGPYIDRDPSWLKFFARAKVTTGASHQPYTSWAAKLCLSLDHENEGRDVRLLLNAPGERAYPMP